jgi:hypothetical protein
MTRGPRPVLAVATVGLAGVALLALPVAARGDVAEAPRVLPGDTWNFAVSYVGPSSVANRRWVVRSVTANRIDATEDGEPLVLSPELNVLDSPKASETNPQSLRFPMAVGQRWRYATEWLFKPKMSRGTLDVEVAVVRRESVTVPAGTFQAYRLEARGELGGHSPSNTFYAGQVTTTYWYAPAARAVVKSVHHNPYQGTTTVQLVDWKPGH